MKHMEVEEKLEEFSYESYKGYRSDYSKRK